MMSFLPSDMVEVNSWCRARGIPEINLSSVPARGYIEPGLGVGWLYVSDSSFAWIDGLISNPTADTKARGIALSSIGERLLEDARELGVKHLIVYTQHGNVSKWAASHEFKDCGLHRMYLKELNQ